MNLGEIDIIACGTKGRSMLSNEHAVVKYNNGNGALLCNECYNIIRLGFGHADKEHFCQPCIDNALDVIEKYARMGLQGKTRELTNAD